MKKYYNVIFGIMLIVYFIVLAYLVFFSHSFGRGYIRRDIHLIPFRTIMQYLFVKRSLGLFIVNVPGNIAAFVPLGYLLPGVSKRFLKLKNLIIAVFSVTLAVEVIQYIAAVGTSDIDDIILNLLGGLIGYVMFIVPIEIKKNYDEIGN